MKSKLKISLSFFSKFWMVFFPIASLYFYSYLGISPNIEKGMYFIALPITIGLSFNGLFKIYPVKYARILLYILGIMILSIFNAYIFHDQSLYLGYKVTAQYLAIIYFFYLLSVRPNLKQIENVIWFLTLTYVILFFYALYKAPELVFGQGDLDEIVDDSRGVFRLRIAGSTFAVLGFFMSINKYVITKRRIWIFVFSILYIVILLNVTRQVIALSFLIGIGYLFYKTKWKWYALIGSFFLYFAVGTIEFKNDSIAYKIINISEEQVSDQKRGEDDIRIQEYKHFFFNYTEGFFTFLVGNGISHGESNFGKKDTKLAKQYLFWDSDVGYAHIYIRFGIIALVLYIIILYKAVKQKTDDKIVYAKLYVIYLILANIASTPILWDPILLSITFYLLESDYQKKRLIKKHILCH